MSVLTGRTKVVLALAVMAGALGVTTWAQGLGPSTSGSLAELTAEVRQLRMTIQETGRSQTQMQALSISLTAQHSRLAQVSARLDASQEELQKASEATRQVMRTVAAAQEYLTTVTGTANASERADASERFKEFKAEADRLAEVESAIRARQAELLAQFRAEEARWIELVAKLEEIIKR